MVLNVINGSLWPSNIQWHVRLFVLRLWFGWVCIWFISFHDGDKLSWELSPFSDIETFASNPLLYPSHRLVSFYSKESWFLMVEQDWQKSGSESRCAQWCDLLSQGPLYSQENWCNLFASKWVMITQTSASIFNSWLASKGRFWIHSDNCKSYVMPRGILSEPSPHGRICLLVSSIHLMVHATHSL